MQPNDTLPWNCRNHALMDSLTAMIGNLQLLQRRLLRADGLITLEREMLLSSLASALSTAEKLEAQVKALDQPLRK